MYNTEIVWMYLLMLTHNPNIIKHFYPDECGLFHCDSILVDSTLRRFEWFDEDENVVDPMRTFSYSPDFNPVENLPHCFQISENAPLSK